MDPQQKNQKKSQQQVEGNNYVLRSQQLPETQQPSAENVLKFFKVKTRANPDYFNVNIGLLVMSYHQYQQDFVTYLANMLMCQADFINIRIIQPNHLYISMNATTPTSGTITHEYLELQSDVYYLLQFCQRILIQFFKELISEQVIFESNINSEEIINKFQTLCIKPIKKKHEEIFNKNNT